MRRHSAALVPRNGPAGVSAGVMPMPRIHGRRGSPDAGNLPRLAALLCSAAIVMAGCASKPVEPAWRGDAADALEHYTAAYLAGNSALAASDFARARDAMSSTGRPDLVAHAELVRCAAATASAAGGTCAGFLPLAAEATAAQRNYAAYLAGQWQAVDSALLPVQHQSVVKAAPVAAAAAAAAASAPSPALAAISDPLSRLVAAGATLQAGRLTPGDIGLAIDTASGQGWRRPLLAWLGIAVQRAKALNDSAEVARLERRIALAGGQ